jgi:hypothetical protein
VRDVIPVALTYYKPRIKLDCGLWRCLSWVSIDGVRHREVLSLANDPAEAYRRWAAAAKQRERV